MKKQYFKIIISSILVLSAYGSVAQNDQPVLQRISSSSAMQKNIEESPVQPELSRSSVVTAIHKNSSDSLERLNTPELKRYDSSPIKKEQPKNSK